MGRLKSAYLWVQESTLRTFVGGLVIVFIVGAGVRMTHAATSQDVSNEVQMNLDVSINATQTTGIILSAPQLNGSNWTFATTTGGVLRIRYGQYREDIHYTSATVDSTTKKVTPVGVTRAICSQVARSYTSCSNGRSWGKGSIVELTVDARLLNLKMNLDRANTTVGSGSILCGSTVNPCMFQGRYTTAQRDAFTWKGGAGQGTPIIHNTTTGTLQWWDGSSWIEIGDTGTSNATETAAGKVEAGVLADHSGATLTGDSGARVAVMTSLLTGTGGRAWRIPYTAKTGILTGSLLGTGDKNVNSGRTHVSGTGAWVADASTTQSVVMITGSVLSSPTMNNPLTASNFAQTGSLSAASINTVGKVVRITAGGSMANAGAGTLTLSLKLGGTVVATCVAGTADGTAWKAEYLITTRTAGASGVIQTIGEFLPHSANTGKVCTVSTNTTSFDTTTSKTVNLAWTFGTTGANTVDMDSLIIETLTPQ